MPIIDPNRKSPRLHFAGVAGSGMSALAQFHCLRGGTASGSDRSFDRAVPDPAAVEIRAWLEKVGLQVFPQDGTALSADPSPDRVVVSTAVEDSVPDVRAARGRGVPLEHRSEMLAGIVATHRSVAVAGTSGKSTVTAMLFELLESAGLDPSVITGGELLRLRERGLLGNAWAGRGDLLVLEADESDGSLVRYEPWMGCLLNLQRDHKEPEELAAIFATFRERVRGPFVLGDDPNLDPFARPAIRFGFTDRADVRGTDLELWPEGSRFRVARSATAEKATCELPVPGEHNAQNALAAIAAALAAGVGLEEAARHLGRYRGVARRFQRIGVARGVEVIDDFAHNPEKIAAALRTARLRARRLLAVYQPHGYGPTRFLRGGLVDAFARGLTASDRLYLPEIFYAGGTAQKDISSADIVREVSARGVAARFAAAREELIEPIVQEAREGDLVLVMGARDPSLTEFSRRILRRLEETSP